jgi:hypothetical protein
MKLLSFKAQPEATTIITATTASPATTNKSWNKKLSVNVGTNYLSSFIPFFSLTHTLSPSLPLSHRQIHTHTQKNSHKHTSTNFFYISFIHTFSLSLSEMSTSSNHTHTHTISLSLSLSLSFLFPPFRKN